MAQPLPRYHADIQAQQDREQLARILTEANAEPEADMRIIGTAGGDHQRIRGVPITARGIGGTSPGTDPYVEVERREHRLRGWAA